MEKKEEQHYVQVLLKTLQRQADTLQSVLQITKEQSDIAYLPDFDEEKLERTLNEKEILIVRLNELDSGFTSVYGRVRTEVLEHKDQYTEELKQMQTLIKRCTDLGVEIRVLEARNRDRMTQCFTQKHKEYGTKKTAANVASRYHQTMKKDNSYYYNQQN